MIDLYRSGVTAREVAEKYRSGLSPMRFISVPNDQTYVPKVRLVRFPIAACGLTFYLCTRHP